MTYKPSGDLITKDGRTSQYTAAGFTETHTVHTDLTTTSTLIAFMLIDLSDTSAWAHTATGHINLEYINIEVDPDSSWTGEIKIGFLENVDGTDGDFFQIIDVDMKRKTALIIESFNFGSHGFDCQSDHHFGPITANSTLFQTDINLGGPDDPTTLTYPSGAGDLALIVDGDGANAVDVSITLGYEAVT